MQRQWKEEAELQMVAAADIVVVAVEEGGRWTLVEAALVVPDMHLVVVYMPESYQVVVAAAAVAVLGMHLDLQAWLVVVESLKREEPWLS